jgi:hypothetical protein
MLRASKNWAVGSVMIALLSGCGQGNDSQPTLVAPTPTPTGAAPNPSPAPAATPTAAPSTPTPAPAPVVTTPTPAPSPGPTPVPPPAVTTPAPTPAAIGTGLRSDFGVQGMVKVNNTLYAFSDPGRVAKSSDGTNWTYSTQTDIPTGIGRTRQVNGTYIATGKNGLLLTSVDAQTWTRRTFPSTQTTFDVAFGGGKYVVAGTATSGVDKGLFVSSDGINWSPIVSTSLGTTTWKGVTYGAGKFVAVGENGQIATSNDAVIWTAYQPPGFLIQNQQVAYLESAGKFLVGANSGTVYSSPDGLTWTVLISGSLPNVLQVECIPTRCVMLLSFSGNSNTYTLETTDAVNLYVSTTTTTARAFGLSYFGNQWVGTGETGLVMTSPNGQIWTVVSPR